MEAEDFKRIITALETGECLAFLGAGACTPFKNNEGETIPGLPTGAQLAKTLAAKCQYSNGKGNHYDLLEVAEHFLYTFGGDRGPLERAVKEEIQKHCTPPPIHTVLAQLNQVKIVITTNYDDLLEQEFSKYNRKLTRHVYKLRKPDTGLFDYTTFLHKDDVVLHKMHGSIEEPGSMVISQSDFIYYLANLHDVERGMPEYFRKTMIPQCSLLFLGYGLEDWNFRVIWEGVLSNRARGGIKRTAYALVKAPTHRQIKYWITRNIDVFDQDLTDFAVQLAGHFNLEIPQMGISKGPQAKGGKK